VIRRRRVWATTGAAPGSGAKANWADIPQSNLGLCSQCRLQLLAKEHAGLQASPGKPEFHIRFDGILACFNK
jgi:hypothetical protein